MIQHKNIPIKLALYTKYLIMEMKCTYSKEYSLNTPFPKIYLKCPPRLVDPWKNIPENAFFIKITYKF